MDKGTAGPVWYLAWVRQVTAMAGRPNAATFHDGQQVYLRQLSNGKWMVFDGTDQYLVLATEDAKLALKTCRDAERKARLAEDQEDLMRRYAQAVARHGTVFACRPRY